MPGSDEELRLALRGGDAARSVEIEARLGIGIPGWLASLGRSRVEADEVAYLLSVLFGADPGPFGRPRRGNEAVPSRRWSWYRIATVRTPSRGSSVVLAALRRGVVTVGSGDVVDQDGPEGASPSRIWGETSSRNFMRTSGSWPRLIGDDIWSRHSDDRDRDWKLYYSCPVLDGAACARCNDQARADLTRRPVHLGAADIFELQESHLRLVERWADAEADDRVRVPEADARRFVAANGIA